MKRNAERSGQRSSALGAALAVGLLLTSAPALAQVTISWAKHATDRDCKPSPASGLPDAKFDTISGSNHVYVTNFEVEKTYKEGLGKLLGFADDKPLKNWDVIAFEVDSHQNPPKGGGRQSSIWFFTDQLHAAAGSFSETEGRNTSGTRPIFKTGRLTPKEYGDFFRPENDPSGQFAALKNVPGGSIEWILIDLRTDDPRQAILTTSERFRIWVGGVPDGTGNPDPDTFGVIRH